MITNNATDLDEIFNVNRDELFFTNKRALSERVYLDDQISIDSNFAPLNLPNPLLKQIRPDTVP